MTFVDRPLPDGLVLPTLREKRIANLKHEGRKPGSTTKITKDLKEGITEAATNIGRDGHGEGGLIGYLEDLALNHKKAFTSLLVKLLPMQVSGDGTLGAHISAINIVSVPSGSYLSDEDIVKMRSPGRLLEHAPQLEQDPVPTEIESEPAPIDQAEPDEYAGKSVEELMRMAASLVDKS